MTLADLGEINKSQIGLAGKYVSATKLTGKQRAQLRRHLVAQKAKRARETSGEGFLPRTPLEYKSNLTAKQRLQSQQLNQGAGVMATRPHGVHGAQESLFLPAGSDAQVAAVKEQAKRLGIRKPISVSSGISNPFEPVRAVAGNVGSRTRGGFVITNGEQTSPFLLAHEMSHMSPKKSHAFRLIRISRSPVRLAREEARADAIATRLHGKQKIDQFSGAAGTAYESNARAVAQTDRRAGRVSRKARNAYSAGMAPSISQAEGFPTVFTPRQARAYADVRRRMGTWDQPAAAAAATAKPTGVQNIRQGAKKSGFKGVLRAMRDNYRTAQGKQ